MGSLGSHAELEVVIILLLGIELPPPPVHRIALAALALLRPAQRYGGVVRRYPVSPLAPPRSGRALEVAMPKDLAIALVRGGAEDGGLAEDVVPEILKDPSGLAAYDCCAPQPLAHALVLRRASRLDSLLADRELGAARRADLRGYGISGEEFLKCYGEAVLHPPEVVRLIGSGMHSNHAAREVGAPEGDVAFLANVVESEVLDRRDAVEHWIVVVPLVALGVDEDHDVR